MEDTNLKMDIIKDYLNSTNSNTIYLKILLRLYSNYSKIAKIDYNKLKRYEDDALKIINYMQSIGINDIDDLLIYRIDIFTILFEQFIKKISRFNIPLLVEYVNSDYTNIDIINR